MNYKKLLLAISIAIAPLTHATIINIESEANLTSLMADNGHPNRQSLSCCALVRNMPSN